MYTEAAPDSDDRPGFVRAASGLAWFRDRLFVIQDDSQFIGVWTPAVDGVLAAGRVESWKLGAGAGGRRRFEEGLGNRLDKSDFEACAIVPTPAGDRLLVLGSGSLPRRELAMSLDPSTRDEGSAHSVPGLFAAFRRALALDPGVCNVEGLSVDGEVLWLHQRGPEPASVAFELAEVLALIASDGQRGNSSNELEARAVRRLALGAIAGCPYGLSDVTPWSRGRSLFLAVAENTSNPIDDGEILGTVLGFMAASAVTSTPLLGEDGTPACVKAEGLAADPRDPGHVLVALDADDPDVPAELCRVRLTGFD